MPLDSAAETITTVTIPGDVPDDLYRLRRGVREAGPARENNGGESEDESE